MVFLKFLIITILTRLAAYRLNISGIRANPKKYQQNEKFTVEVFGKNLPDHGYYFTTADRCEDHNRSAEFGSINTYYVESVKSLGKFAYFDMPYGLPFDGFSQFYHLCVEGATHIDGKNTRIYYKDDSENSYAMKCIICIYCVLVSAFSSGMTIGLMRFSIADLKRMLEYDEPIKTRAQRILRFRRRSNWLVCTFSLCSTIHSVIFTTSVETMLEGHQYYEILSILVPTLILFIFAEFLPQAICNSKFGFTLASGLWPITVLIFIVCSPVAWPASKVIDLFLKRDVREVMTEEEKLNIIRNMAKNSNFTERKILEKATTFSSKTVKDVMTPIEKVFLLSASTRLTKTTVLTLVEKGFTRVPIRDDKNHDNIFAVLNIKDLINYDLSSSPRVAKILSRTDRKSGQMNYVVADMKVQELMQQMRTGGFHIAAVCKFIHCSYRVIGIITIEDILEQIFGDSDDVPRKPKNRNNSYKDSMIINWCREAGSDQIYPLSFSQQLLVIQSLLAECPIFNKLAIDVLQVKQLLRTNRIRKASYHDKLPLGDNALIIVWDGQVEVKRHGDMVAEEVTVRQPDARGAVDAVAVFVAGKRVLNQVVDELKLRNTNPCDEPEISEVSVLSEKCMYFKIRKQEIIDIVNETETSISKSDQMQTVGKKGSTSKDILQEDLNSESGSLEEPKTDKLFEKIPSSVACSPVSTPSTELAQIMDKNVPVDSLVRKSVSSLLKRKK